ncbi:hypothetical protein DFP73DRAFT_584435 [Morchella snyderi]|nr:hypothetical protein DFP73DRAFT_584435 [Morchella snyderi]
MFLTQRLSSQSPPLPPEKPLNTLVPTTYTMVNNTPAPDRTTHSRRVFPPETFPEPQGTVDMEWLEKNAPAGAVNRDWVMRHAPHGTDIEWIKKKSKQFSANGQESILNYYRRKYGDPIPSRGGKEKKEEGKGEEQQKQGLAEDRGAEEELESNGELDRFLFSDVVEWSTIKHLVLDMTPLKLEILTAIAERSSLITLSVKYSTNLTLDDIQVLLDPDNSRRYDALYYTHLPNYNQSSQQLGPRKGLLDDLERLCRGINLDSVPCGKLNHHRSKCFGKKSGLRLWRSDPENEFFYEQPFSESSIWMCQKWKAQCYVCGEVEEIAQCTYCDSLRQRMYQRGFCRPCGRHVPQSFVLLYLSANGSVMSVLSRNVKGCRTCVHSVRCPFAASVGVMFVICFTTSTFCDKCIHGICTTCREWKNSCGPTNWNKPNAKRIFKKFSLDHLPLAMRYRGWYCSFCLDTLWEKLDIFKSFGRYPEGEYYDFVLDPESETEQEQEGEEGVEEEEEEEEEETDETDDEDDVMMDPEEISILIDKEPIRESDFHPHAPWNQEITDAEVEESMAHGTDGYEDGMDDGWYEDDDEYDGDEENEGDEGDEGDGSGKGDVNGEGDVSTDEGDTVSQDSFDDPSAPWNK